MKNFLKTLALLAAAILPATCVPVLVPAQTDSQMRAVMAFVGASSEEDLDEQEIERFLHFFSHPLEINLAGEAKLLSSGLLTRYQVASLEDYRSRSGDILSLSELAAVDGFGNEYVSVLGPFISLKGRLPPGGLPGEKTGFRQDVLARTSARSGDYSYALKYKASMDERAEVSLAGRTAYKDRKQFPPSSHGGSVAFYGRRPWKIVAGDYNLRFGQGLALWSGLSLTGFSSSSSFYRRPSGLSPSGSWSGIGTHRGVAGELQSGGFVLTPFVSLPGLRDLCEGRPAGVDVMPGAGLSYFGRTGQVSVQGYGDSGSGMLSSDFRWNRKGVDLFGEVAADLPGWKVAAIGGTVLPLGRDWKLSTVLRFYPEGFSAAYSGGVRSWTKTSDETGLAAGLERHGFQLTADWAAKESDRSVRQGKVFMKSPLQLGKHMVLTLRVTERYRPYEEYLKFRTGARMDLDWSSAGLSARYGEADGDAWKARFRLEGILCRSASGLTYLEGGRKTGRYSACVRGTLFFVDNWDDRIYSYERDVPGSFTVPAYYGRGFSLSASGGCRFRFGDGKRKTLKLNFRVSSVRYPFMKEPKPARNEARIQATVSL